MGNHSHKLLWTSPGRSPLLQGIILFVELGDFLEQVNVVISEGPKFGLQILCWAFRSWRLGFHKPNNISFGEYNCHDICLPDCRSILTLRDEVSGLSGLAVSFACTFLRCVFFFAKTDILAIMHFRMYELPPKKTSNLVRIKLVKDGKYLVFIPKKYSLLQKP